MRWAQQFETAVWLDSNKHRQEHHDFDTILAIEEFTSIQYGDNFVMDTVLEKEILEFFYKNK